jgi:eukaryotic translation initiation factor 2C
MRTTHDSLSLANILCRNPDQPPAQRDAFIQEAKDLASKASLPTSTKGIKVDDNQISHPIRPGFGTRGTPVTLFANHMRIMLTGNLMLHRYDIGFPAKIQEPGVMEPTGKKRKRLVELLLQEHFSGNSHDLASDYKAILISKVQLSLNETGVYPVVYRSENEDAPDEGAKTYQAKLQKTQTHSVNDLTNYLTSTNVGNILTQKEEIIQSLNIIFGHHPKTNPGVASAGANRHYDMSPAPHDTWDLGAGLVAIRGFFVSVRAATSRLLVNVQVKNGAFYQDGDLVSLINVWMHANHNDVSGLGRFLKRLSVHVTHLPIKKNKAGQRILRVKKIYGLATAADGKKGAKGKEPSNPPKITKYGGGPKDVSFWYEPPAGKQGAARYISVYDYFKQVWNVTLKHLDAPVVNLGDLNKPIYVPSEVCVVLSGQPVSAMLSPQQTQAMIRNAVRKPAANAQSIITSGIKTLGFGTNPTLAAFGLSVDPVLITVPGRILPAPAVKYKNEKTITARSASWNMVQVNYSATGKAPGTKPYWGYLRIKWGRGGGRFTLQNPGHLGEILQGGGMIKLLHDHGLNDPPKEPGINVAVDFNNLDKTIEAEVNKLKSWGCVVLIIILPPQNTNIVYNAVKRVCDVTVGIHNVCVQEEKIVQKQSKGAPQYWANVDLKLNLKLGGQNQHLDKVELGILAEGKTMVIGLDVTHPSPGSSSTAPSVAALVSSVDSHLAQWPAQIRVQKARQEQIDGLEGLIEPALKRWQSKNSNSLPENILVCRDGVSEGQYQMVAENELKALQTACKNIYPADMTKKGLPHFTVLIVGKRHNTRFYPTDTNNDKGNPQPGTVVDRGVTELLSWDFYLQAHGALQGTARPAHYYVIHDDIFRRYGIPTQQQQSKNLQNAADALEQLMHAMCYLFGRATKAVSICPPAYYADIACERARCYLSGMFEPIGAPSVTGTSTSDTTADMTDIRSRTTPHAAIRDSMFYI